MGTVLTALLLGLPPMLYGLWWFTLIVVAAAGAWLTLVYRLHSPLSVVMSRERFTVSHGNVTRADIATGDIIEFCATKRVPRDDQPDEGGFVEALVRTSGSPPSLSFGMRKRDDGHPLFGRSLTNEELVRLADTLNAWLCATRAS